MIDLVVDVMLYFPNDVMLYFLVDVLLSKTGNHKNASTQKRPSVGTLYPL